MSESLYVVVFISNESKLFLFKDEFEQLKYDMANKKEFSLFEKGIINHADVSHVCLKENT